LIETEYALIGCMIIDNFRIPDILNKVSKDDFQDTICKKVFKKIAEMFDDNIKIDLVSLNDALKNFNINIETLTQMVDIVPSTEAYNHYIELIKKDSAKKKLSGLLQNLNYKLNKNEFSNIEVFKSECIEKLNFDTGLKNPLDSKVIDYLTGFLEEIKINKNNPTISTGFPFFNKQLGGGINPGFYVLGSISSLGKTSFTLQMADQIAANGHNVLYLSTEMSKTELVAKSISRNMFIQNKTKCKNIGTLNILKGNFYNYISEMNQALIEYEKSAKNLIIQKCKFNVNIEDIINMAKSFIYSSKNNPVIIVDYLQTINADAYNDKQKTDLVVAGLKEISSDYSVPVIAISSFNRNNYAEKVDFSSFKESGGIEYTADTLIGLQLSVLDELDVSEKNKSLVKSAITSAKMEIPRRVTAIILKQRNGLAGARQNFLFHPITNYFEEV
jgi:replicative DNA helicase